MRTNHRNLTIDLNVETLDGAYVEIIRYSPQKTAAIFPNFDPQKVPHGAKLTDKFHNMWIALYIDRDVKSLGLVVNALFRTIDDINGISIRN